MSDLQDIGFFQSGDTTIDLAIENGDLKADNSLETAVLISLFSDRFVETENLPYEGAGKRGWWADLLSENQNDLIGSRLWTLERGKMTKETEISLVELVKESLNWLKEDGIADTIEVVVERDGQDRYNLTIEITKPSGDNVPFQFIWDGQELKGQEAV